MAGVRSFFDDVIGEFESDIDKVHKGAFVEMITEANRSRADGGLMPVDTGDLQDSLSVNGVQGKDAWVRGVRLTPLGGVLVAIWNAPYAGFVEGGTRFQRAQPFARTAIAGWGAKVAEQVRRL